MMRLYGIPNCDTVKKARHMLSSRGIVYEFHDFKKNGVDASLLGDWLKQVGWQKLLKKTEPTCGKLPQEVKDSVSDYASALTLMLQHPNIIKRPVLIRDGKVLATGFDENEYGKIAD